MLVVKLDLILILYQHSTVHKKKKKQYIRLFFISTLKDSSSEWNVCWLFLASFQQVANNSESPGKMYPELRSTVLKFLRKHVGDAAIFPEEPMFRQDYEHILDTIGLEMVIATSRVCCLTCYTCVCCLTCYLWYWNLCSVSYWSSNQVLQGYTQCL